MTSVAGAENQPVRQENPEYGQLLQKVAQMRVLRSQLRARYVQAHSKAKFLQCIENSTTRDQMRVSRALEKFELFF